MNETVTPNINAAASAVSQSLPKSKKRAKKSPEDTIKALQAKQAQIDAKIKKERAKITGQRRKEDTRRKIIAGALALENMTVDANFRATMQRLIADNVRDNERHLFDL